MKNNFFRFFGRWTPLQRFTLASFIIMVAGMIVIGLWVGEQIKIRVVNETAATTALYMDSFIAPNVQELSSSEALTPKHIAVLDKMFKETYLGRRIVAFKVWDKSNRILFSENPKLIGRIFPEEEEVERSYKGEVVAEFTNLDQPEQVEEAKHYSRLLQIYSPIRQAGGGQIIAVAEFYQTIDTLEAEISQAQRESWLIVGLSMMGIYLLLVGFVRWADRVIRHQETALASQVTQLTDLLARNAELNERVKRAAANSTELNERFLRRISAELHDGPIQELGLALLRLDRVVSQSEACSVKGVKGTCYSQLLEIQESLERSMQEVREISKGLGVPQLENMTLPEILQRVVKAHERRTDTRVILEYGNLPEEASLPFKITLFRFVQEALNNAFHHAGGKGQKVQVACDKGAVHVAVSDEGAGFDPSQPIDWEEHLGLAGMRERVESLGGEFQIQSQINRGTTVLACLMLQPASHLTTLPVMN